MTNTPQTLQKHPSNQTTQEEIAKSGRSDARNRERIALGVLVVSIAAIAIVSVVVVHKADDKEDASQRVMDTTFPLYGTWVGTVLAFYFSRNAFEAASNATNQNVALFQQATSGFASVTPPSSNVLEKIALKSLANNLIFSQNDLNKPLQEVLDELIAKNRYRTIVVDADKKYVDLVYRINAAAFLTQQGDSQDPSSSPTLRSYLEWRNSQGEKAKHKVVFLTESATLADADAKLKEKIGCSNVIVTTDGKETSPVVAYITDADIHEYKCSCT